MRTISFLSAIAATMAIGLQSVHAGLLSGPLNLQPAYQRIKLEALTLPPMSYTQFCLRYVKECRNRPVFRGGPINLTPARLDDLKSINKSVNAKIVPEANRLGLAGEVWLINPTHGDCNDYAVTKRHELLNRGWPARALLLSEVIVNNGEHHLVLVVRTKSGDLVLDNLTERIRPWSQAPYRWVRIQRPNDNRLWATVAGRGV